MRTIPYLSASIPIVFLALAATSALPALANNVNCTPAGTTGLTALIVAQPHQVITGTVNAAGCDVGIFVGPGVNGVMITHANITGANDHGIFVQDASNEIITNNVVWGNGVAPHICGHPPVFPCIAEDKALQLVGTSNSLIMGNVVKQNLVDGGVGVADDGPLDPAALHPGTAHASTGNILLRNVVSDNFGGCGIVVAAYNPGVGASNNLLLNNFIQGSAPGTGPFIGQIVIATDGPNATVTNTLVIGNTLQGSILPGIVIHSNAPGDLISDTFLIHNNLSNNGFYPPSFATPNTPTAANGTTGIAIMAEAAPGMPMPPAVINTFVINNNVMNDVNGVWLCNTSNTVILHLTGNSTNPVVNC